MLTTILRRLALPLLVFLIWTPVANAWSRPVQGPVLQAFSYDEAHPYASGQHRGIDIGADTAGENVVAPAAGTVSFAGTVPTNGKSVTIETADGYSVTLTHLGSILVGKGTTVEEAANVGTIGPSGTPEFDQPYVHLGIRLTADPNGYLDPLRFLPPPAESEPAQSDPPPTASVGSPAKRVRARPAGAGGVIIRKSAARPARPEARPRPSVQRPAVHATIRAPRHEASTERSVSEQTSSSQRPVVEAATPRRPAVLGAGHEVRPSGHLAPVLPSRPQPSSVGLALACNGAAALVALLAAFVAGWRRRRTRLPGAQILQLPRPMPHRRAA